MVRKPLLQPPSMQAPVEEIGNPAGPGASPTVLVGHSAWPHRHYALILGALIDLEEQRHVIRLDGLLLNSVEQ
jgi:hypothetical protein